MKPLLSHPFVRIAFLVAFLASSFSATSRVEGQLFGERGLFGEKEPPLRNLTEDQIGVPFPKTGRVQAVKGQEVRFEIHADSKAPGAAVEFLIRTMPTAGKILSLVENPNARNRAIVTYLADPSTSAEADVFGFAVRYRGGRYSSEMRFDIDLVDVKAEIRSEPEIDFGEVMVGEEAVREIAVRNLGTGDFRRQIYLTAPWRIVEPANGMLLIPPKQARMVKIGYRPVNMGEASYLLSFSRTKGAMTKLIGSGTPPFALQKKDIELTLDPVSGSRSGQVVLENVTGKPLRLSLRGSQRVRKGLPEMVLLPPDRPYSIEVTLPETDVDPFDGTLLMSLDTGYAVSARLIAAVVPGRLKIEMPNSKVTDVINYGRVTAGRTTERGFRLTNTGGVAVPLEFHIPDPFRLLNDPGPQLSPQASVNLAIGVFPAASRKGPVDVTMSVLGSQQNLPVRLLANVIRPEGASVAAPSPLNQIGNVRMSSGKVIPEESLPEEETPIFIPPAIGGSTGVENAGHVGSVSEPTDLMRGVEIFPIVLRERNAALRSPEDLSVFESSSKSLTVGWTAPPNSELSRFEIEFLALFKDEATGLPQQVWAPVDAVEFERVDRLVKARIDGLNPYSSYVMRVFTLDENGRASAPSDAIEVSTELPMDWTYIYLFLGIGFVGLVGFGAWKIIQSRQPEVYQAKYADA